MLAPELWLRRGLTYNFKVYGGNNPHSAELYHPIIITDEPRGGYDKLNDESQSKVRVLAGVEYSLRRRPVPTAGMLAQKLYFVCHEAIYSTILNYIMYLNFIMYLTNQIIF